jgi:hypothetical protein
MRDNYDFSGGIRGKYTGTVDTTDIRRLGSMKPVAQVECRECKEWQSGAG